MTPSWHREAGTYGGLDAVYDDLGATDASVQRFADDNAGHHHALRWRHPDPRCRSGRQRDPRPRGRSDLRPSLQPVQRARTSATLRPPTPSSTRASRRTATTVPEISGNDGSIAGAVGSNAFRTDNTGAEFAGFGGNDNRDSKTGHVAGTFAAVPGCRLVCADRRLHELPRPDRLGQHRRGQLHVPARSDRDRCHEPVLADGVTPATTAARCASARASGPVGPAPLARTKIVTDCHRRPEGLRRPVPEVPPRRRWRRYRSDQVALRSK